MITLTEKAAKQVEKIQAENEAQGMALRLVVQSGGCSGHEYGMGFDEKQEGDHEFESHGVKLLVDEASYSYLQGAEVDFDDGLQGKGFEVKNPNAKNTCGCGKSFH